MCRKIRCDWKSWKILRTKQDFSWVFPLPSRQHVGVSRSPLCPPPPPPHTHTTSATPLSLWSESVYGIEASLATGWSVQLCGFGDNSNGGMPRVSSWRVVDLENGLGGGLRNGLSSSGPVIFFLILIYFWDQ